VRWWLPYAQWNASRRRPFIICPNDFLRPLATATAFQPLDRPERTKWQPVGTCVFSNDDLPLPVPAPFAEGRIVNVMKPIGFSREFVRRIDEPCGGMVGDVHVGSLRDHPMADQWNLGGNAFFPLSSTSLVFHRQIPKGPSSKRHAAHSAGGDQSRRKTTTGG